MTTGVQSTIEISPRKLTRVRLIVGVVVAGLMAVVAFLYVVVRTPLMREMGVIAGPSRTTAVVLGWAVWGGPLLLALLYGRLGRDRRMPRRARITLVSLLVLTWAPALALLPARGSEAQQQLASLAIRQAPMVASSLVSGIGIGALSTLLCLLAIGLSVSPRSRHPRRFARLDRGWRPVLLVTISVLALTVGLAFGRAGPPGLRVGQLWPAGASFSFNGELVKPLDAARSASCAGRVLPGKAEMVLLDDGCGGVERGLFTNRNGDALVSLTLVAMPTPALAHTAAAALDRMRAVGVPLATPSRFGHQLDGNGDAIVHEDVGSELMVLVAGRSDGKAAATDARSVLALGRAVANTVIYGITGAG